MTPTAAVYGPESLLGRLADPAARTLVLAGIVGIALAGFRVKSTLARLFAWTAVLYAALAMPLLGWMLPALPVSLPALPFGLSAAFAPAARVSTPAAGSVAHQVSPRLASVDVAKAQPSPNRIYIPRNMGTERGLAGGPSSDATRSQPTFAANPSATRAPTTRPIPWLAIALAMYFIVAASLLLRFSLGLVLARRLMRAAEHIRGTRAATLLHRYACAANLPALPRLAQSEAISVPVTLGVREPSILLPADWHEWDDAKLDAVLAHELSHVARRDALTQRLSRIHRAIFWFSPLAWWLDRQLADLAEEASDEAALSGGVDRADYARTLLGFFEALQTAPGRVWWQGVAMAKAGQAERRVDRILSWKGAVSMGVKKSVVVLLIALSVPVLYLTAGVRPNILNFPQQETATPPPQPATPIAPRAKPAPAPVPDNVPAPTAAVAPAPHPDNMPSPAVAPVPMPAGLATVAPLTPSAPVTGAAHVAPAAPVAAWPIQPLPAKAPYGGVYAGVPGGVVGGVRGGVVAQPAPPWGYGVWYAQSGQAGNSTSSVGKDYGYAYGYDDDGQRYVIVSGNSDSITMSGDSEDAAHARALRKKIQGDFIWFERDEKSYIIRDQATIDRARNLFKPQEDLGRQQEELGKQQEALGEQQEALGKKMEEIRVKVPDMSADIEKLKADIKKLADGGTQEELGELQSEIGELQSKIGELQSQAGEGQGKLSEEMGRLGEQQGRLGEQQGRLGRKQGELGREAAIQMRHLLDDAIKSGTAQPEP